MQITTIKKIVVIAIIRDYDGFIDNMLANYGRRVKEDQGFRENFVITLHLKDILDKNPSRLTTFEEMVIYLEEQWNDTVYGHF